MNSKNYFKEIRWFNVVLDKYSILIKTINSKDYRKEVKWFNLVLDTSKYSVVIKTNELKELL